MRYCLLNGRKGEVQPLMAAKSIRRVNTISSDSRSEYTNIRMWAGSCDLFFLIKLTGGIISCSTKDEVFR